jgi:SSS family solute:Na+ symporter
MTVDESHMGEWFHWVDLTVFFTALVAVMAIGLLAGRGESESSEQYFLAGRQIRWWGVAGSIYGSNVSANHLVGMLGLGFSIGFAQSHFELGAIFGLLMLCYGFLPVYRRLKITTLSEYLGRRYDDRSRLSYAVIMVLIMVGVQMMPGLYIGARSACVMVGDDAVVTQQVPIETVADRRAIEAGEMTAEELTSRPVVQVDMTWYSGFIILLALVSTIYTVVGGLRAVVLTDAMQSLLLLGGGILLAVLIFTELGDGNGVVDGWNRMLELDQLADTRKMQLYLPSNHPKLPWSGVLTGLIFMHCFYWGTNQFIVQRALAARSDAEARLGIIVAGFLKLLIPFFAIAAGIAGYYLITDRVEHAVDPDAAFAELVRLVVPAGVGLIGIVAAGLIGAILSSIDSMMNSAATIFTIDVYQKFIRPDADDRQLVRVGRLSIIVFVVLATGLTFVVIDPNSKTNFFLQIVDYSSLLTPGLLVAFLVGMFWRRATATGAVVTIFAGVVFSLAYQQAYQQTVGMPQAAYNVLTEQQQLDQLHIDQLPAHWQELKTVAIAARIEDHRDQLNIVNRTFGPDLNFFHRVVAVIFSCLAVHVVVSLKTTVEPEQARLTWTDLGGHDPGELGRLVKLVLGTIGVLGITAAVMKFGILSSWAAALIAAAVTLVAFRINAQRRTTLADHDHDHAAAGRRWWSNDRTWAAILCAAAVWMHFFFA